MYLARRPHWHDAIKKIKRLELTKIVLYTKIQNVTDKWLKRMKETTNRVFVSRQEIKDTFEERWLGWF